MDRSSWSSFYDFVYHEEEAHDGHFCQAYLHHNMRHYPIKSLDGKEKRLSGIVMKFRMQQMKPTYGVGFLVIVVMVFNGQFLKSFRGNAALVGIVRLLEWVDPVEWPTCRSWGGASERNDDRQSSIKVNLADIPRLEAMLLAQSGQCYVAANLLQSSLQSTSKVDSFLIGRWYLASGDHEQAVEAFRKGSLGVELRTLANAARGRDKPELALRWDDVAFEVAPDRSSASRLSAAYLRLGMQDEAIGVWQRLGASTSSSEADYWLSMAQESCLRDDAISMNEAFDRAIALAPQDASLLIEYATCLRSLGGQLDTELRILNQACLLEDASGCLNLGYIYSNLHDYEQAKIAYEQAITIFPSDPKPKCAIGVTLWQQGDLDAAESILRDAIAHHPGHYCGHRGLATVLYERGRLCEAIQSLEKAVDANRRMGGRPTEWVFTLADWYVKSGQVTKASLSYEQILKWEPDNEQAASRQRNLATAAPPLEACR